MQISSLRFHKKKLLIIGTSLITIFFFILIFTENHVTTVSGPYVLDKQIYQVGETVLISADVVDNNDRGFLILRDGNDVIQKKVYFSGTAGPKDIRFELVDTDCALCLVGV